MKPLRRRPIWSMPRAAISEWIVRHDPASTGLLPVLLNFKGYVALQAWRVSNWLWRRDRRDLALLLQSESSDSLQVSIHPSASIGTSVFLDHATGIVVGAFVTIGDEVTIMQNVTIGRKAETPRPRSQDRQGRPAQHGGNHSRRRQHRRLCQDRRGVGRDQRRAERLYGGRRSRAPDQLPRTGSSLKRVRARRFFWPGQPRELANSTLHGVVFAIFVQARPSSRTPPHLPQPKSPLVTSC